jgi:hypothetical protein
VTLSDWLAVLADVASVTAFALVWLVRRDVKRQNGRHDDEPPT